MVSPQGAEAEGQRRRARGGGGVVQSRSGPRGSLPCDSSRLNLCLRALGSERAWSRALRRGALRACRVRVKPPELTPSPPSPRAETLAAESLTQE